MLDENVRNEPEMCARFQSSMRIGHCVSAEEREVDAIQAAIRTLDDQTWQLASGAER